MVSKEGVSFLPKQNDLKETGFKIRKSHLWMLAVTLALILCWNALLTVDSLRNPGRLNDFPQFENIIKQEENTEVNSISNATFFKFFLVLRSVMEDNSKQM